MEVSYDYKTGNHGRDQTAYPAHRRAGKPEYILEVEPGHVRLSIELTEACLNLYGNAHGGFLFSLCDIAAGMSTYACEVTNVTQCAGINFVRGVNSGTIYVESNIVHKGRHTAVCRVDITGEEEELLATGNFTMFLGKEI